MSLVGRAHARPHLLHGRGACAAGGARSSLHEATGIDPMVHRTHGAMSSPSRRTFAGCRSTTLTRRPSGVLKRMGLSDVQIGHLTGADELDGACSPQAARHRAARSRRSTPAPPSSLAPRHTTIRPMMPRKTRSVPTPGRKRVMIFGAGPNRIGQGIEFDYCCVHASYALRDAGYETIMVNCNPETVSTDYDTSDKSLLRAAHVRGRHGHRRRRSSPRAWWSRWAGKRR